MSMGDRVRKLREGLGMKPVELARKIGLKQPSIWAIENGVTKTLRANTLRSLCAALHTTPEYLLDGRTGGVGLQLAAMEAELTFILRTLTPERRVALLEFARHLLAQEKPGTSLPPADEPTATVHALKRTPRKPRK